MKEDEEENISVYSFSDDRKMNTLSIRDLCCLFCCPPFPSRIAAKLGRNFHPEKKKILNLYSKRFLFLAFLPPEPTYSLLAADNPTAVNGTNDQTTSTKIPSIDPSTSQQYKILFSEKAEWQHSSSELTKLEPYFVQTSRHNRIACLYINCTPNPKYHILFSHGNAVDLGK